MKKIHFSFSSKIELINIIEQSVEIFLKNICKIEEDSAYWFMVGFHELTVNAYLHGNKKNPDLPVEVEINYKNRLLTAKITDRGSGFDARSLPDPTLPENLLKPSGRGILFAKKSCDKVEFLKKESGFTVIISKKVKEVSDA